MVSRTGDLYVVLSVEPELAYPFTMASIIRRISVDAASVPKLRLLFGRRYYVVGFRCGRRPGIYSPKWTRAAYRPAQVDRAMSPTK